MVGIEPQSYDYDGGNWTTILRLRLRWWELNRNLTITIMMVGIEPQSYDYDYGRRKNGA